MNNIAYGGDFIKEISTTTTTGPIELPNVAAPGGYVTWDSWYATGGRAVYSCRSSTDWEVGVGTYNSTTHTITRDYTWWSTNGGNTVDFTGQTVSVFSSPNSGGSGLSTQYHWIGMTADPLVNNDVHQMVDIASFWVRQDNTGGGNASFICVDPAVGAAIWLRLLHSEPSNTYNYHFGSNVIGGYNNTNHAMNTVMLGRYADGYLANSLSFGAAEPTSPASGQHQVMRIPLALRTTDATPSPMILDGSTSTYLAMPASTTWWVTIEVVAWDSANNLASSWSVKTLAKRNGTGTPTIVGTTSTTAIEQDGGASSWAIGVAIDSGNNALQINATGQAAHTISWTASVNICQAK